MDGKYWTKRLAWKLTLLTSCTKKEKDGSTLRYFWHCALFSYLPFFPVQNFVFSMHSYLEQGWPLRYNLAFLHSFSLKRLFSPRLTPDYIVLLYFKGYQLLDLYLYQKTLWVTLTGNKQLTWLSHHINNLHLGKLKISTLTYKAHSKRRHLLSCSVLCYHPSLFSNTSADTKILVLPLSAILAV